MAYNNPFIKFTFGGTTANGNEIWSCGLSIGQRGSIPPDPIDWFNNMATKITTLSGKVTTLVGTSTSLVPDTTKVLWVKMALIGLDGKYMTEAVEVAVNQAGLASRAYNPAAALVVTLDSGKWKDPGKYNRYYLPTVGPATTSTYQLSTGEQSDFLAVNRTFIKALNTELAIAISGQTGIVAVTSPSGPGYDDSVTSIKVGRVVDSQRRRRNKLPESYATATIP